MWWVLRSFYSTIVTVANPQSRTRRKKRGGGFARRVSGGGYTPPGHSQRVQGAIFARFAGSGFAVARVRPAHVAESRVGAGREFPECPGKGWRKTIAHSATGKAFFRPSVRSRRVRANATRWPRPRSAAGAVGFVAPGRPPVAPSAFPAWG